MRLKLAIRNTFRSRGRTALNVFMIASGVSALVLFKGYSYQMILTLREEMIRAQFGHLQIAQKTFWDQTAETPKDNLIPKHAEILDRIRKSPHVASVTGRMSFYGLAGARDRTVAAQVLSLDPQVEVERLREIKIIDGKPMSATPGAAEVILGSGLAASLRTKVGENINLLGYTYDGVVNAVDLEVVGIFQTTYAEIDNVTAMVTLEMAQKLLDTDSVEKLIINLHDTDQTSLLGNAIATMLDYSSPSLRVRPWSDLATLYRETSAFFRVYDGVIEVIILCLVLIGILNTVGMSVYERTGEIGTIRALGETEPNVIRQFLLEGVVLGLLGGLTGVLSGTLLTWLINAMEIPVILPGASRPIPIVIALPLRNFIDAVLMTLVASIVAAAIPAIRATRIGIADALRRNI